MTGNFLGDDNLLGGDDLLPGDDDYLGCEDYLGDDELLGSDVHLDDDDHLVGEDLLSDKYLLDNYRCLLGRRFNHLGNDGCLLGGDGYLSGVRDLLISLLGAWLYGEAMHVNF